ncbi:MAG: hypothetical protein HYY55_00680 [Candidatus Niyogibacteria bacterium]|nr:MAG: hypothetical protein HYY55_00680 [Candidatus Niyogibacteria bacterium]
MHNSRKAVFIAVVIFLIAVFFRFWMLGSSPPGLYPDEAMNGNNALYAGKIGNFSAFYSENNGREGLFMNIIAASLWFFGNEPWAIRLVSAIFGALTVLGVFYLGRELFRSVSYGKKLVGISAGEIIALSASFFMAVSFWHINFSRIGFRAIMAPFFLVWGLYFLWLVFRDNLSEKNKYLTVLAGGFIFGLGANSYIAYRVAPLLLIAPFLKMAKLRFGYKKIAVFLAAALIAFLPLGLYYLQNPGDFLGRTSQISIFSEISPVKSLALNSLKTLGALWFSGDQNPRHNLPEAALLWWPVGILFAVGLIFSIGKYRREYSAGFFWLWIAVSLAPAAFSSEGVPHALRSIMMLPAIMYFAAIGFWEILSRIAGWLDSRLEYFPKLIFLIAAFFASNIIITYSDYFTRWTNLRETYFAFNANYVEIGRWLNRQPEDIKKYVVVNAAGVPVSAPDDYGSKSVPMPSQTVMFLTDTWPQSERTKKNFYYISPQDLDLIDCKVRCLIIPLENDPKLNSRIRLIADAPRLSVRPGFILFYKGMDIK